MVEPVGTVVGTVLRRSSESNHEMSIASLHPFCVRLYCEHLLPANGLQQSDLPPELANPASLLAYLRTWNPLVVEVVGEEGAWGARLVQPAGKSGYSGSQPGQVPEPYSISSAQEASSHITQHVGEQAYANGVISDVSSSRKDADWDETTYVRQLLCTTLLDYVLASRNAVHYSTAASLEECRDQCIRLLVKAFPEAPPELLSEECLEDLLLSQGNSYMITIAAGRRKMLFKPPPAMTAPPPQAVEVHSASGHAALPPRPAAAPQPAEPGPVHANLNGGTDVGFRKELRAPTPASAPPAAAKSAKPTDTLSGARSPVKAPLQVPQLQNLLQSQKPGKQSAVRQDPAHPTPQQLVDDAIAYLQKHRIFDGPKSIPVERLRTALAEQHGFSSSSVPQGSALETLASFRALLGGAPGVTVWVSKASDVLRCMLDAKAAAAAPASTPAVAAATGSSKGPGASAPEAAATAVSPAYVAELVKQAPTMYKAAHLYLASQQPPAISPSESIKVHVLLKAMRAHSSAAAWHSHPALHSIQQMLKYLRTDTSIVLAEDPAADKVNHMTVWIKAQHGSYKAALKTLESGVHGKPEDSGASNGRSTADEAVAPPPAAAEAHYPVVDLPSGYPQLGRDMIEVWGPTGDPAALRAFLAQYGSATTWGFDYKTNMAPKTRHLSNSQVTLVTLATRRACLIWDVSAGALPAELRDWIQDGSMRKCRMAAKGSANVLASSLTVAPRGFIDLRELFKLSLDKPVDEGAFATFPAIATQVLDVRIVGHNTIMQSNWAVRPLTSSQVKYTAQNAWLHAHLFQSLGAALHWDVELIDSCMCEARAGLLARSNDADGAT